MSCSLTSILVLFLCIHIDLKNGHAHLGFPTSILYIFLFFLIQAICNALLTPLDLMRSSSPEAIEYAVLSDPPSLPPFLVKRLSQHRRLVNPQLYFSLNIRQIFSHPYKTNTKK